ncbi:MAG: AAA family ATPase [Polyangiaceae bacterium]|nr:AAA family ATPase [Polyangiaceae bacterium]
MITRLYASNYKSIGEGLDLRLGPLTVLVGPNGSGKSNIIDVLRFLHECVNNSLSDAVAKRLGVRGLSRWSPGKRHEIELAIECANDSGSGFWGFSFRANEDADERDPDAEIYYLRREFASFVPSPEPAQGPQLNDFLRSKDGSDLANRFFSAKKWQNFYHARSVIRPPMRDPFLAASAGLDLVLTSVSTMNGLSAELQRIAVYSLFPNTLRAAQNPNPVKPMMSSGDNWASTLKALNKREWGAELSAALHKITGDIDDYRVVQAGGYVIPEFRHGKGRGGKGIWRGAAQESDGTLRIAAMLTALFQEPAPALIGFEEPELAVHPGALPILYDYLVEASKRSQIVITTHSPELMDLFDIDCIRVVERKSGVTTVAAVEERQRELVRKRLFSTSELLHAEGLRPEGSASDE